MGGFGRILEVIGHMSTRSRQIKQHTLRLGSWKMAGGMVGKWVDFWPFLDQIDMCANIWKALKIFCYFQGLPSFRNFGSAVAGMVAMANWETLNGMCKICFLVDSCDGGVYQEWDLFSFWTDALFPNLGIGVSGSKSPVILATAFQIVHLTILDLDLVNPPCCWSPELFALRPCIGIQQSSFSILDFRDIIPADQTQSFHNFVVKFTFLLVLSPFVG